MHILLVNDDGIHAPGIKAIAAALKADGHRITVCAPDRERSAASHSATLSSPLHVKNCDFPGADKAWAVDGTPSDCARLGLFLLSSFYLGYSLTHYKLGTVRMPKEGFMPMIVGIAATLISAFLLVQSLLNKGDAQNVKFNISWKKFFLLVVISLAYALLLNTIGYTVSSFVFLFAVLKIAGVEGWKKPLLISAIAAVAFWLIFKVALGVMLPTGVIGF